MRNVVILAGGSGTRLWPLSRAGRPKQLLPLSSGRSLLELAYRRAAVLVEPARIFVCTAAAHTTAIAGLLPQLPPANLLGEPMGRDTAAAVALSAAVVGRDDPGASVAMITADHLITPEDEFAATVSAGFAVVESTPNSLCTFGITPTHPHDGLGYVERGELLDPALAGAKHPAYLVDRFREKPDTATAERYLATGRFWWNSGMFVWRCDTLLDALADLLPEVAAGARTIGAAWGTERAEAVLAAIYPELPRISIDYAVLEPLTSGAQAPGGTIAASDTDRSGSTADPTAPRVVCVGMDVNWLDIGSFVALGSTCPRDEDGNAVLPDSLTCLVDSGGNVLVTDDPAHLIAGVGLHDHLVVHTADVTLVCPLVAAERIKELVGTVADRCGPRFA